jgi:hypothetical protein
MQLLSILLVLFFASNTQAQDLPDKSHSRLSQLFPSPSLQSIRSFKPFLRGNRNGGSGQNSASGTGTSGSAASIQDVPRAQVISGPIPGQFTYLDCGGWTSRCKESDAGCSCKGKGPDSKASCNVETNIGKRCGQICKCKGMHLTFTLYCLDPLHQSHSKTAHICLEVFERSSEKDQRYF